MNKPINEQVANLFYYASELYYSTYTTLSIQVMKCLMKSLASQRPRDNSVFSFITSTGI